ncbi:MAG: AraC family transcriptional regulator [Aliidongia sp.]
MDEESEIFKELVPLLRVQPELEQLCRFGAQWASPHGPEPDGWAPFHIVTAGSCLLDAGERTAIPLTAGDVAVLPHGGPHTVRALPTATGRAVALRVEHRLHDDIVLKSNVEGEAETKLICGRLRFEHAHRNMVLAALPDVIVLAGAANGDAARVARLVELMQAELEEDRIGAAPIASGLASSLMIFVLRSHLETAGTGRGILALLTRRQTARALAVMLADPAHPWTLDELAELARTSRATLVRQFQTAVDMAPVAFLADLRLNLARSRIRASHTPLAIIAEEVGYQSETAFSRAYQRHYGIAPGGDRKARTE